MKKFFKILRNIFFAMLVIGILTSLFFYIKWNRASSANLKLLGEAAPTLTENSFKYRDLNKNEQLDAYEDSRLPIEQRVENLVGQMNLEEKAGLMFITMINVGEGGKLSEMPSIKNPMSLFLESNSSMVAKKKMNHFNVLQVPSAEALAIWNNNLQKMAERTRLGIPVTLATDPRHTAVENIGAAIATPFFSNWCSPLGLASTRDTALVKAFGDIARQEYTVVGLRLALSPMADLATEPRWARVNGTFGEDAELSASMTKAYIQGFQGDSLTSTSVACMTKHFSGGGPQKDGEDAHFPYGKDQVYPGNNFDYHLIPFEKGAFPAKTAQIMPYYGVPVGQTDEAVAFGYNKEIITGMLREKYGFEGVICTDWGLVSDHFVKPAAAHGVEDLFPIERVEKIINAGNDMFGGEAIPDLVVELVKTGKVSEARLDVSVKRILRDKFRLGLFDNPYLDLDKLDVLRSAEFLAKGKEAQQKSLVLLKNENQILPLKNDVKIYVEGIMETTAKQFANVVSKPEEADFIILKLNTPYEPRSQYMLERFFHQGRLHFTEKEKEPILKTLHTKPTITVMNLQRPAIIPDINAATQGLIADFDCSDEVILELIFGQFQPNGKLPFELPSSIEAVEEQLEDVPYDSKEPLYPFGYGLTF